MRGSKSIKDRENILKKCVAVFCVSEYIKKQFIEGVSFHKEKVHVLHNGVEKTLEKFPTKKKEILFSILFFTCGVIILSNFTSNIGISSRQKWMMMPSLFLFLIPLFSKLKVIK